MKTIQIEIPDGKKAEWIDGVLTLVDDKPVEFKFGFDDAVRIKGCDLKLKIYRRDVINGRPCYCLFDKDGVPYANYPETELEPYTPKDITTRIKTFVEAEMWCRRNGKEHLVNQYYGIVDTLHLCPSEEWSDILAYLKLRIITCALNGGLKSKYQKWGFNFAPIFGENFSNPLATCMPSHFVGNASPLLCLKTEPLAEYAATQFKDIYLDFCYKGKE